MASPRFTPLSKIARGAPRVAVTSTPVIGQQDAESLQGRDALTEEAGSWRE